MSQEEAIVRRRVHHASAAFFFGLSVFTGYLSHRAGLFAVGTLASNLGCALGAVIFGVSVFFCRSMDANRHGFVSSFAFRPQEVVAIVGVGVAGSVTGALISQMSP